MFLKITDKKPILSLTVPYIWLINFFCLHPSDSVTDKVQRNTSRRLKFIVLLLLNLSENFDK